jgi:hypothetical protein
MELIKMKSIKAIEDLYRKAVERAAYEETAIGHTTLRRNGIVVYQVFINWDRNEAVLSHYGTTTIRYNMLTRELVEWYGEGVSDRDSMNTFMACLNEDRYYFRYGSRMGFVMEDEWGDRHGLVSV